MPANWHEYVMDNTAAVRLGKALFWDMQLGSDGKTACASCHFRAGADTRTRNQVSPGLNRLSSSGAPNPDRTFQVGGPNYQFQPADFPFHRFSDPNNRNSTVTRSHNDVASSQGVFKSQFVSATPGAVADTFTYTGDTVFQVGGRQARQVEPRNTPSMINSIFNFRNFWDGRATYLFNGATPFGAMDENARVYKTNPGSFTAAPVQVRIEKASLASLATGPALSDFEMSGAGRTWPEIGLRLLPARALVQQQVSTTDSSLAVVRHSTGVGLTQTYQDMVRAAFRQEWWNGTNPIAIGGKNYTQMQANFSLFFGLAIQAYGATLVSDDSPFDRHMVGDQTALSTDARLGMAIFFSNKGKCANCHGGAEFTNAATRKILKDGPMARMVMGDGATAVYDEGFYNIAVTRTLEDIANGATNPVGRPMATTALAQRVGSNEFQRLIGIPANVVVGAGERIAVNGAFKTPGLRNVELTAPYFHNGDSLTLEQVVEFYNRGGNHFQNNIRDVDADIQPLGLTADERRQLVAFLHSLTDNRVRYDRAPFDHPQLVIPNGHGSTASGSVLPDLTLTIPAVGREGFAQSPINFLENTAKYFQLVPLHSNKCVETFGRGENQGDNVNQWSCNGGDHQKWEEVPLASGGFMLRNKMSGRCLDVSGISYAPGANIYQWACLGTANQTFTWVGSRLRAQHSGQCVNVWGNSTGDGANVVQYPCSTLSTHRNDQFAKRP
jgi:cytochrome c peroxidase